MITFDETTLARFSKLHLIETLDEKFRRDLPRFASCTERERGEFLVLAVHFAEAAGFRSMRGIGAYALACWWLGFEFEKKSEALSRVLAEERPEFVRRSVMDDWVARFIGSDGDLAAADASIAGSLADAGSLL